MPTIFVCLLAGACSLEILAQLPPGPPTYLWALACGVARCGFPPACFLAGFLLMWWAANTRIDDRLDLSLVGQNMQVIGVVESFPLAGDESIRFRFAPVERPDLPKTILLGWYENPYRLQIGETWQLIVRLRTPRGLSNPAGFDYAGWLFREGIGATGHVVEHVDNRRMASLPPAGVARLRQRFVARTELLLPADDARAVLMAIGVGARHQITTPAWDTFAKTGTSHLMAVSGLHVGLAASCFFLLSWLVLAPFCKRTAVRDLATCAALLAALSYSQVAGFAVPATRAFLMIMLPAVAILARRRIRKSDSLACAGLVIVLADPLAILMPGFKMSFAAVFVIFAALQVYQRRVARQKNPGNAIQALFGSMRRLWRIQAYLWLGLFPLSVILFDRVAPVAPFANMLILPIFSLVTVPLCLLGMLLDGPLQPIGDVLLRWSYESVARVLTLIDLLATPGWLDFDIRALSVSLLCATWLPILYVLLPAGWPGRRVAFIAVIGVVLYQPKPPPQDCMDYIVLDVGQGLAVVLRTATHTLIYDTGPRYRNGSDVATSVILPYLASQGIDHIDRLVVSHSDLDHVGGLDSILEKYAVAEVLTGEMLPGISVPTKTCRAGTTWHWDGVEFRVIHPRNRSAWSGNNLSCVLLATMGAHSLLLTGDIERPVEILLDYRRRLTPADTVVVPHHGSGTSSSYFLADNLSPSRAIVSAGYENRWGMPKDAVVKRWQSVGAQVINTASSGAISQRVCAGRPGGDIIRQRQMSRKYWHDR